jgi:hypothetical protein
VAEAGAGGVLVVQVDLVADLAAVAAAGEFHGGDGGGRKGILDLFLKKADRADVEFKVKWEAPRMSSRRKSWEIAATSFLPLSESSLLFPIRYIISSVIGQHRRRG